MVPQSENIFDRLYTAQPNTGRGDALQRFLDDPVETVSDPLAWWDRNSERYDPRLARMAKDYLSIPGKHTAPYVHYHLLVLIYSTATSVDVERVFSTGRLLLSHIRNRLSAQTTRALLCLNNWSKLGLVKDEDVMQAAAEAEANTAETADEVADGWDRIVLKD